MPSTMNIYINKMPSDNCLYSMRHPKKLNVGIEKISNQNLKNSKMLN